jgi:formylglycine-generating enzyme required for sulfatase activity
MDCRGKAALISVAPGSHPYENPHSGIQSPRDLKLDREIRDLKDVIEKSGNRQRFEVEDALAVRVGDLHDLFFRHRPQIVHFCGHGSGQQGLVFESNDGGEQWVRAEALSDLFRLFTQNVGCVLLNACYSEEQANAIVNHIDYVIGMSQEIQDNAAIAFSKGFYRALGYQCSIEEAYEFGKNAIQLEISGSSKVRSAATEDVARKVEVVNAIQQVAIPEHLKPILKTKPTLAPSARANITPPVQSISSETRAAIQLDIDKSLEADTKVKQYRDRVREFLTDRKLTALETIRLERLRKDLGLPETEAKRILEEEQEPIRKARDEYEAVLIGLIEAGHYPVDAETQNELRTVQQELGLSDEEVGALATPILAAAEEEYQAGLKREQEQEYQQKLQRYEQEFRRAIEAQYPLDSFVRDSLRQFQQSLGLSDINVAQIEQLIIVPKEAEYQQLLADEQRMQAEAERQRELKRQQELEQRQKLEEQQKQKEYQTRLQRNKSPEIQRFEFDVITVDQKGNENSRTRHSAEAFSIDLGNGVLLEMVKIPGGTFLMGSPEGQGDANEQPQHSVTLKSFAMGKYPVTQEQWRAVASLPQVKHKLKRNPDPLEPKGDDQPVDGVSWYDAVEFCDRLSQCTQMDYRLPSEAEWEYACRAGTTTNFYFGQTLTPKLAQCKANFGIPLIAVLTGQSADVGSYLPNTFGLYDMHGNVWEWCLDHWHGNYDGAPSDGTAWLTDDENSPRLQRGGSYGINPRDCRSAVRIYGSPHDKSFNSGFRVVCALP